jgi:hypothetical protein
MRAGGAANLWAFAGSRDARIVRRFLNRCWIYGIHGSRTYTGGTASGWLSPFTGALKTTAQDQYNLPVPGWGSLPLVPAMDEIINLCPALTSNTGLTANAIVSGTLTRRITEDTATSGHSCAASAITLTDGVLYMLKCGFRRVAGTSSRTIRCFVARSGQRAGFSFDPATGVVSSSVIGGGTVGTITQENMPDGSVVAWATISNAAWGGTVIPQVSGASGGLASYEGDGSVFDFIAPTISAAIAGVIQTPLAVAEGATRARDLNVWTTPAALPQISDIFCLAAQLYSDGDMGIATQTYLQANDTTTTLVYRGTTSNTMRTGDNDGAFKSNSYTRGVLPNRRKLFMHRKKRTAAAFISGYATALGVEVALTAAGEATPAFNVGHGTANRASAAANGCIINPYGDTTQAEIEAFYRHVFWPTQAGVATREIPIAA